MLFSQIEKIRLLEKTQSPRMIFIGGSNLSFGLDSKMIHDSLHVNPINTAIHASIGLKYMLGSILPYIRKNDIVIVSAEYQQFYGDVANGRIELLSIVCDISPNTKNTLDRSQYCEIIKYAPKYALSKLNPLTFFKAPAADTDIYDRLAFNAYGDACKHWQLPKEVADPISIPDGFNNEAFDLLINFKKSIEEKKAVLFITYPAYQQESFEKNPTKINQLENLFKSNGFILLGTPKRYEFPDSLIFNTPYHLTGKGVKKRTELLIEDLKKAPKWLVELK